MDAAYWLIDLDESSPGEIADLLASASVTLDQNTAVAMSGGQYAPLFAIASEEDGGIIAYALGREHAERIVTIMNTAGSAGTSAGATR